MERENRNASFGMRLTDLAQTVLPARSELKVLESGECKEKTAYVQIPK